MANFKIVFIHGYTASSKVDWYPQISEELRKMKVDFIVPDLPGGEHPHAEEWLEVLHTEIGKTDKSLVLVGHSLGTRTALLYLEKYHPQVEKVFLIAAFANDTANAKRRDEHYADFFAHEIDIASIKHLAKEFIVMHSKEDSSIPYEQGERIAKDLGAELITYEDRDHFSDSENALIVVEVLKKKLYPH